MKLSDFKAGEWVYTATHIELEYIKEVTEQGWYILTNGYIETTIFCAERTPAYPLTIKNKVKCNHLDFEYEKLRKIEAANNMTHHVFQEFAFRVFETDDDNELKKTFDLIKEFIKEVRQFRCNFVANNWLAGMEGGEQ